MMKIRSLFLLILLCIVTVSAHRLPGEQDTRVLLGKTMGDFSLQEISAGKNNLTLRLQFTDTDAPVQELDVVHEKKLHVFLIGSDLTTFIHDHPENYNDTMDARRGSYTLPVDLLPGKYLVVADFSTKGKSQFHTVPLTVKGESQMVKSELQEALTDDMGNYDADISWKNNLFPLQETELLFNVRKDGIPIKNLDQYLGAALHVVVVSSNFSLVEHTHSFIPGHFGSMATMPQRYSGPTVPFRYAFPSIGKYVLFVQFKHEGKVRTARFVVQVRDPLKIPYIWLAGVALVAVGLLIIYIVRKKFTNVTK